MDSKKEEDLQNYTVQQLKAELRSRHLPTTGNKDELVVRLHQDNVSKEEHGILDDYKRERTKRLSQELELKSLQMQLNQLKQDEGNRSNAGVKITKVDLIPAEDGKELTKNIEIQGPPTATVTAVNVNGLKLEPKTTDDKPHFEASGASLKIVIPKMSKEYLGHYQATFAIDPAATPVIQVTKNILEVKPK